MLFFRHARKHFSQAEGSQLDEVRQVMGMLAFPPDTHISPYKVMFMSLFIYVPAGPWSQELCGWLRELAGSWGSWGPSAAVACCTQPCCSRFIPISW